MSLVRAVRAVVLFPLAALPSIAAGAEPSHLWTLRAERAADGATYCYAAADRGPGERLTVLRSETDLALVLTSRAWRFAASALPVEIAVGEDWRGRSSAAVGDRTLVLNWRDPEAISPALADGGTLRVVAPGSGLDIRWSLAGMPAALAAVERCRETDGVSVRAGLPPIRAPQRGPAADRATLARHFEHWLRRAAPTFDVQVTPVTGSPSLYRLQTTLGRGAIRLFDGGAKTHLATAARRAFLAICEGDATLAARGGHRIEGVGLVRSRLVCVSSGRAMEALTVGYGDGTGGFVLALSSAAGGANFTAVAAEDLAARLGRVLDLPLPDAPS